MNRSPTAFLAALALGGGLFSPLTHGNDSTLEWADRGLSGLGGKTVRLKLGLSGARTRLYAVYLDPPI